MTNIENPVKINGLITDPKTGKASYCFINSEDIKKMNKESIRLKFNRSIDPDIANSLSNSHKCLVFFMMSHESATISEPHLRIMFYGSIKGKEKSNIPEVFIMDTTINSFNEKAYYIAAK